MMSDLRAARLAALAIVIFAGLANAQTYELVISGGRVMDPESGLDAVRDVGIIGGKIAAISETPLSGAETISADGLVVAPGFIDLHAHGQNAESRPLQAGDGVTTALELEALLDVGEALAQSALQRTESRGSHQRTDHPERDDEHFLSHSLAYRDEDGGPPRIEYEDVTITNWPPGERVYGAASQPAGDAETAE